MAKIYPSYMQALDEIRIVYAPRFYIQYCVWLVGARCLERGRDESCPGVRRGAWEMDYSEIYITYEQALEAAKARALKYGAHWAHDWTLARLDVFGEVAAKEVLESVMPPVKVRIDASAFPRFVPQWVRRRCLPDLSGVQSAYYVCGTKTYLSYLWMRNDVMVVEVADLISSVPADEVYRARFPDARLVNVLHPGVSFPDIVKAYLEKKFGANLDEKMVINCLKSRDSKRRSLLLLAASGGCYASAL